MQGKVKVLVAGCGNTTGINVIKALLAKDISLIGCDCDKYNPSVLFCENIQVPRCSDANYIQAISDIVDKHQITHIIPCNDHDLRELSCNIELLRKKNVILNGYGLNTLGLLDKKETLDLFISNKISTPLEISSIIDFPYVLRKEKMGSNRKFVHIVKDQLDLSNIPAEHHEDGIKTRFVDGVEFTVDVICGDDHIPLSIVPRLRIVVINGMVHHAKIVKDDILIQKIIEVATRLKLTGISCIQCIKDSDNGYHFIEINPRPGSGIDLSINGGINMPYIWVQYTLGLNPEIDEPNWGLNLKRFSDGYFYKEDC